MWTRRRCTGNLASKTFPKVSLKFPQWSATSREIRGFFSHHRCSYCRCSTGRAAYRADPPARSSADTYSVGTAALERNRSAAAKGFPCQCCCLKQQSGTTEHPTKGVMVLTGGQSRCMNRPISAPVECETSLRLGREDQNNWFDVMKRLQLWDVKPCLIPSGSTETTELLIFHFRDLPALLSQRAEFLIRKKKLPEIASEQESKTRDFKNIS